MESRAEIYKEYAELVFRFLLAKTGNESLSEELTQETFYQAIKSSDKFDDSCKVSTWLCAIAKNTLLSYIRKNHLYKSGEFSDVSYENLTEESFSQKRMGRATLNSEKLTVPSPEETVLETQDKVSIIKALHAVPEPYKEVLYLRIFGNLSFREIGEIMEKTENWARVTFYRGKEKLRWEE